MNDFKGIVAAILTPFDDNDKIDFDYIKRHIRFVEEGGVQGIVPSGTNGEFPSLTLEERKQVIETAAKNKGKMFMVAGTGATVLSETIELTKFAESVGTDAVMVAPPYFLTFAPEQGFIEYYKRVFDAVSVPIFLYNIPGCTGVKITDNMVRALIHYPHLAGIKDSSGDLPNTLGYVDAFPTLKIFVGNDLQALTAMAGGAVGHITGMPNALPELTTNLYKAFIAGEDASEKQMKLSMARNIATNFPEFSMYKYILSKRGFPLRHSRLPLLDMTEEQGARLKKLMQAHGLWNF